MVCPSFYITHYFFFYTQIYFLKSLSNKYFLYTFYFFFIEIIFVSIPSPKRFSPLTIPNQALNLAFSTSFFLYRALSIVSIPNALSDQVIFCFFFPTVVFLLPSYHFLANKNPLPSDSSYTRQRNFESFILILFLLLQSYELFCLQFLL